MPDLGWLLSSNRARSPGLHVSDIYNSLYAELEPARYGGTEGPHVVKMAMGLAWEAYLERRLEAAGVTASRPIERMTDEGIAYSPDLLIGDPDGSLWVGEIKLTWMAEAETLDRPKFSKWLTQAKAYCFQEEIPRVRFYVLFVNGNCRDRRDPVFRVYDIEFEDRELQENWQMLLNHARHKGLI